MSLEDRIGMLEGALEKTNARLAQGAQTFSSTDERFAELHTKIEGGGKMVFAVPFALLLFLGGLIWQAASYPNRDEFNKLRSRTHQIQLKQTEINSDVQAIRGSQTRIEASVAKIGDKLDEVLLSTPRKRR